MKSQLSVVADSGSVEVWVVKPDVLDLMPPHVQEIVLERLKKKRKQINHKVKESDRDIDEAMNKFRKAEEKAKFRNVKSQFNY